MKITCIVRLIDNPRKIIVVTGTPGVGKSTVSSKLSEILRAEHINLSEFVKSRDIPKSYDKERETWIVDEEDVKKELLKHIEKVKAETIIVEGHFAVHTLPQEKICKVLVLRRDPRELKDILEKRGYSRKKVKENVASEILDVCLVEAIEKCGQEKICEIDVTSKDVDKVVEEALLYIKEEAGCKVGVVDWLGRLEKDECLAEFLDF